MKLTEAKEAIEAVEHQLANNVFCEVCRFERDGKVLTVCITDRLKKQVKKGRVWKSKAFLTAFKMLPTASMKNISAAKEAMMAYFFLTGISNQETR